jgi:hypothetical protein
VHRSALSGKPIEGDAASEVELLLPDGRRRRLLVQAAEAEELAAKGRPIPGAVSWIPRGVQRFLRAVGKWALLSLVGVLVVQALAKQVSDRQKELELKRALTSDLGSSSFEAFAEARSLAYLPRAERTPARRLAILTGWISDEGRLDGSFRSYLPKRNHAVGDQWLGFRDGLYTYLLLACCQTPSQRSARLEQVDAYLRAQGATQALPPTAANRWQALRRGPGHPGYARAYDWLGGEVLLLAPYRGIEKSKPEGFSIGFGDFLHDAIPGY